MYTNHRHQDFVWGVLLGSTLATLTALLFTTKKGKKIQQKISDTYEEIEDSVKDAFTDSKEKLEETGKKIAHKAKQE